VISQDFGENARQNVMNPWWQAGESWQVDRSFSGSKNMAPIVDLFWRFVLGTVGGRLRTAL